MSSRLSWSIIKQFASRNMFAFRFQDVVREFPGKNRVYLARILKDMVHKGMLCKIARSDQGRKRSKFGLKINVDPILIQKKVLHHKIS